MARILTICPYRLLPLRGGGALRSFHLLRVISQRHELHAIVFQQVRQLRSCHHAESIPGAVRLYSPIDVPPPHSWFHCLPPRLAAALHYRWLRRSLRGPASTVLLQSHHLLESVLRSNQIEIVVYDGIGAMTAAPLIRRLKPEATHILNAFNVDHRLLEQRVQLGTPRPTQRPSGREIRHCRWVERHLDRDVDLVWVCSEDDRRELGAYNSLPIYTVPNGVDTTSLLFDDDSTKASRQDILFCGSLDYEPNIDGLYWFLQTAWPRLAEMRADARLIVVGRGGDAGLAAKLASHQRVELIGEVDDVRPFYRRAGVVICPLRMGSGTRLKILEAMSSGNPVVSTTIGAQGIDAESGTYIVIADQPRQFAESIALLQQTPALFDGIRRRARQLVQLKYDWSVSGAAAETSLQDALARRVTKRRRVRYC